MSQQDPSQTPLRVLRIDASMRRTGSITRDLSETLVARLAAAQGGAVEIVRRDLADGAPLIDESWIAANFTPAEQRTDTQRATLAHSDALVAELKAADIVVVGAPIYNFGVPAALKAWIDQVARARETFRYSETGPVGLLEGKKAYLVIASGGTEADSQIDFATPYLRHVMGFIGIHDVEVIAADRLMADADAALSSARAQIESVAA